MLLALLLHLLVFHLLTARDDPVPDVPARKDTGFVVRHIDKCPNVGYYFKRETPPNSVGPGVCYLCFCQRDRTAICWKRENKRCDKLSFHHREIGSQDARQRRSLGLSEFFREASKDFFIKQSKPECKPFESTFSEDCPPVDWCTGCTVCDCNANGKWDCHLLSFCADEKKQKQSKGARRGVGRKYGKKPKTSTTKTTATVKPKPVQNNKLKPLKNNKPTLVKNNKPKPMKNNKPTVKAKNKATVVVKHGNNNKTQAQRIIRKSIPHKMNSTTTPVKRRTPIRYKRISTGKSETTKKMIKKNVVTHKPIEIKTTKHNLEMIIAQKLMQKVMGKLRKSVAAEMKNMSMLALETVKRERMKYLKKPSGKPKGKSNQAPKTPKTNPGRKPMYKPAGKQTKTTKNYIRNKRDLNAAAISVIPINASIEHFLGTPNVTEALPFTQMSSNLVVPDNDNDNTSHTVGSSTLPENEYYKYVVGNEEHKTKANAPLWDAATTRVNITETVFDLIGAPLTSYASTEKGFIMSNSTRTVTNFTETTNLKHSKWTHLKILKEKKINALSDKHKSIVKLIAHNGRNRKMNSRKYNIVKVVHGTPCMLKSCLSVNTTNAPTVHKKNSSDNLQNLLKNIIQNLNKTNVNSTESIRKKKRKFSILRYLKKIFNKIFKREKPNRLSKHHLIETLCENFGPCRVSRRNRRKLNVRVEELDSETTKILKTVKIIKGLLKLVELPKLGDTNVSKQESFNDDIIKLNNILRGNYAFNLSDTQTRQVEYIKKNTEEFIVSVRKFAKLLNEIISILNKEDTHISKKLDLILSHKNNPKYNPFQGFRNLLIKYNLVQNSFMKRMYEQLNSFESNHNMPKVSAVKGVNNSVEIENFSRNIIQNLRKLKRLAHTVSSSGRIKREISGDDDAIEYLLMLMEYLIKQNHPLDAAPVNDGIDLLIEAIKNAPDIKPIKKKVLEYTPATYSDETTYPTTITAITENTFTEDDNPSDSEKSSSEDSGKMKLEDTELKLDENKEFVDMVTDDDKDPEENNQYDRQAGNMKVGEITETSYFNRLEQNIAEPENDMETTTPMPMEMDLSDKQDSQDDVNIGKTLTIEQKNLGKATRAESRTRPRAEVGFKNEADVDAVGGADVEAEPAPEAAVGAVMRGRGEVVSMSEAGATDIIDMNEKKFEVLAGDIDEEANFSTTTPITGTESPTAVPTEFHSTESETIKPKTKMRRLNLESYDSESLDKKSKLEWIEENFGKNIPKDFTDIDESNNTTTDATIKYLTDKSTEKQVTEKLDVSNLTKEAAEEAEKNKIKTEKQSAEDVMLRKQMDLLNSLDYGTEKGETLEPDSKDTNAEDRYSGDTFPSYFI
ncbi:hypothetical protein HF086_017467 [Spodoptera exigua]|uniref:Uncharacterized protein n=1 Tax=Spodoptera exigua TaxID=7107 RepID=A0A922M422_SPOEX|nr:hypothetical protein HF086_017467 [Spodoptera exigua]